MSQQFGQRLKYLRIKNTNLSQTDIAKRLYIDRSTYSYYELGKTEPSVERLKKLAQILGVSVDCLLNYEDAPETDRSDDKT